MEIYIPILMPGISYGLLFLLCYWVWLKKGDNLLSEKIQQGQWFLLHLRHAGGLLLVVVLPAASLSINPLELLKWPFNTEGIKWLTMFFAGIILIILAVKESGEKEYKHIIPEKCSSTQVLTHLILRSFFLAGYEWFFRGVLLFNCIAVFGVIPAIIINIILYALIHSFNGKKELVGSVPLGIMLCMMTLWWHSVWPAILLHLVLSSTHETIILKQLFSKRSKLVL